jgi:hypothetical protein
LLWSEDVCYGLKAFEAELNLLHKHVSEQIHVLFPSCEAWGSVVVKALRLALIRAEGVNGIWVMCL